MRTLVRHLMLCRPVLVDDMVRSCQMARVPAAVDAALQAICHMCSSPELQQQLLRSRVLAFVVPLLLGYDTTTGGAEVQLGEVLRRGSPAIFQLPMQRSNMQVRSVAFTEQGRLCVWGCLQGAGFRGAPAAGVPHHHEGCRGAGRGGGSCVEAAQLSSSCPCSTATCMWTLLRKATSACMWMLCWSGCLWAADTKQPIRSHAVQGASMRPPAYRLTACSRCLPGQALSSHPWSAAGGQEAAGAAGSTRPGQAGRSSARGAGHPGLHRGPGPAEPPADAPPGSHAVRGGP